MTKQILTLLLLLHSLPLFCQEEILSEEIISVVEELAGNDPDPSSVETFIGRLTDLSESPVKINTRDETEISRLFFLSEFQIKSISDYIATSGPVKSVYELTNLPGFDREIVQMMIPFMTLDEQKPAVPGSIFMRHLLLNNFSLKSSDRDSINSGAPWKLLSKYKFTASSISGGVTIEKDAGEKFLTGNPKVPDFLSAHLSYTGNGIVRKIIAGDFGIRFGMGTCLNTGIRTGISLTAPGYMSGKNEIREYTSADENNFFRGIGAEFAFKKLGVIAFISDNLTDATTGSAENASEDYIENFYTAGLHNSPSLIKKKDNVGEVNYGAGITYNLKNTRIGFAWTETRFSLPVGNFSDESREPYEFYGDINSIYTATYKTLVKKVLAYGEFSANPSGGRAIVQGVSLRPSDRLTLNFLYRNYSAGFTGFHGRAPGTGTYTRNERGIIGNFTLEAAKHLFLSAGYDFHQYPWIRYRTSFPSSGKTGEIRLKYNPVENLNIEISYNRKESVTDNSEERSIPGGERLVAETYKGLIKYGITEDFSISLRLYYKLINPSGSKGTLLAQDVNYRFPTLPVSLWIRYSVFRTGDWDSRLYVYENDLLYSFSIPALAGTGSRSYIMAKWEISDNYEMRIKYGISTKSAGLISPDDIEEIRVQVICRF